MEKHITLNGGGSIISDYRRSDLLPIASRRKVIAHAAEFLIERFGNDISSFNKMSMAKALLDLFPILKYQQRNVQPFVSFKQFASLVNVSLCESLQMNLIHFSTLFTIL